MSLRRLMAALPPDFALTLVDVGSAGGLHPRWRAFAPILSAILFDPREAAATGELGKGKTRIYPVALGDKSGEAELRITALPNMSSFLQPLPDVFGRFWKKGDHACLVASETVGVDTLDRLASADGFRPNVLKVDAQGSELMVLKGATASLGSVMLVETEISFFERYAGQPLFGDLQSWLAGHEFELIDLYRIKRYRAANSLGIRQNPFGDWQRPGRAAYGDAIFLRSTGSIIAAARADGGASLLAAVVALLAYGKADHAAALLDEGSHLLPDERVAALRSALRALNRRRFIPMLGGLIARAGQR